MDNTGNKIDSTYCANCKKSHDIDTEYCLDCGSKLDLEEKTYELKPKFNRKHLISTTLGFIVVIALVLGSIVFMNQRINFKDKYGSLYSKAAYVEILDDGTAIKFNSKPSGINDTGINPIDYTEETKTALKEVLEDIGLINIYELIITTNASGGVLGTENFKYKVTWQNHPDYGLEVIIRHK